jgi:hypothetical protein
MTTTAQTARQASPTQKTWCSKCSLAHGPPLCAWAARPTIRTPTASPPTLAPLPSRPSSPILGLAARATPLLRRPAGGGGFARRPFAWR